VPRQSRSARSRARSRRTVAPAAPATTASPPPLEAAPTTAAPRARTTVVRPQATPGSLTRGFVTDYAFIIGELKRIFLLTAGIVVLLLVLWLILG